MTVTTGGGSSSADADPGRQRVHLRPAARTDHHVGQSRRRARRSRPGSVVIHGIELLRRRRDPHRRLRQRGQHRLDVVQLQPDHDRPFRRRSIPARSTSRSPRRPGRARSRPTTSTPIRAAGSSAAPTITSGERHHLQRGKCRFVQRHDNRNTGGELHQRHRLQRLHAVGPALRLLAGVHRRNDGHARRDARRG